MVNKIYFLSKLYSIITETIEAVEVSSSNVPGEMKLKEAMETIEPVLSLSYNSLKIDKNKEAIELLKSGIPEIISGTVKVFHAIGIFTRKEKK